MSMETKFEKTKRRLDKHWGFMLTKNESTNLGYLPGSCKTGYTVSGSLRGYFWKRYSSLAQIEKAWLKDYYGE